MTRIAGILAQLEPLGAWGGVSRKSDKLADFVSIGGTLRYAASMRACVGVVALSLLWAGSAEALPLLARTSSTAEGFGPLQAEVKAAVFTRLRGVLADGGTWASDASLTRARMKLDLRLGRWLRANLEPEFRNQISPGAEPSSSNVDLAEFFLEVRPISAFRFRVGQMKVPFGAFERPGRFELPVINRGLVSQVLDRTPLDFVGRRFGLEARVRLKEVPLSPELRVGGYGDLEGPPNEDFGFDLSARIMKKGRLHLSGMSSRSSGGVDGRGYAGGLGFEYRRKAIFTIVEVLLGRSVGLLPNPARAGDSSTFFGVRGFFGYSFALADAFDLQPYVAAELMDPNLETTDDLGTGLRGGVNLIWLRALRLGLEFDRYAVQAAFIVPQSTRLTLFLGVSLE